MEKVTDKSLIDQLNKSMHIQKSILPELHKIEDPGAIKTFAKSAFNATPEAIGNLMSKLGLSNPEIMQQAIYGKGEQGQKARESHEQGRIADIGGSMTGFGPLGLGTGAALRTLPMVGRAVEAAAPSLLKRTGIHALEGGTQGALYAPGGHEGEGFGLGALFGGALGGPGVSIAKNIPRAGKHGKNIANIEELRGKHSEALGAHEQQQAIIEALKRHHQEQGAGLTTPESITRQINAKHSEMQGIEPQTQLPHENTDNLLNYPAGEELIPHATKQKEMGMKEIEHYLNSGISGKKTVDVEIANEINSSLKKVKQHIQKNYYEPVEEYTKNNYIQLPRTADVKHIEEQLSKISTDPQFKNSPGFEKLKQQMIKQGKGHDLVNAHDFVKQWKETKQAAAKARRKGYQEGGEDQAYWQDQAANMKEIADQQLQILQHHLPKLYFDKLTSADKLWKDNIVPFYGNRLREQAKKLGRIDVKNIPNELRGAGMGQEKMLELFLANPKLTRLALAHSHGKNLEGLLNAGAEVQPFIEKLPALQGMLNRLHGHNRNIEIAKLQHQQATGNRRRVESAHNELVKQQKVRQDAIQKSEKIKSEIINLERKRHNLTNELKTGEIKEREFKRLDDEIKITLKSKKMLLSNIGKAASIGTSAFGAYEILKNVLR